MEKQRWILNVKTNNVFHYSKYAVTNEYIVECDEEGTPLDGMQFMMTYRKFINGGKMPRDQKYTPPEEDKPETIDVMDVPDDSPAETKVEEIGIEAKELEKKMKNLKKSLQPMLKNKLIEMANNEGLSLSAKDKNGNKDEIIDKILKNRGV